MEKLVIGIDAGGTSVRAALARAAGGDALRTASAGAGNPRSVPAEVLADRLTTCVAPLAEAAGPGLAAVVAGVAGAEPRDPGDPGTRRAHAALRTALHRAGAPETPVHVRGDTEIAFAAGPGAPADGVVLIAGTGASAARIADRRQTATIDGHGWLLGDEGSGFWVARQALRAALRALDGRGPATELVRLLTAAVVPHPPAAGGRGAEETRIALVDAGFAGEPVRIARLCPVVVRAADAGDAVAAAILDEAADRLAETVAALTPAAGEPLVTTGGLLSPRGPLLARFAARVRPRGLTPHPVPDGLAGAVALARAAL